MTMKDRFQKLGRVLRLDPHHAIERLAASIGALALLGAITLTTAGVASAVNTASRMSDTALWTSSFTTSKTQLEGDVDGVFTSTDRTRALVMMHFDDRAKISTNARDYRAFLMGANEELKTVRLTTPGLTGSFHVFGTTGYVGLVLESAEPFHPEILNLTIRANAELEVAKNAVSQNEANALGGDESFGKFDQWRLFLNPGATNATTLPVLDGPAFDPAAAYSAIVLAPKEQQLRTDLDLSLQGMRASLNQISAYTADLATTKVDGIFLRAPELPPIIAGDQVTGQTAAESGGESTLQLEAAEVVPGGFDFDWRSGSIDQGYLDQVVPEGRSYVDYLTEHATGATGAGAKSPSQQLREVPWILSNGQDLMRSQSAQGAATLRPLTTLATNLTQAYTDFLTAKTTYETKQLPELLQLEVELRDVRSNTTSNTDPKFLALAKN